MTLYGNKLLDIISKPRNFKYTPLEYCSAKRLLENCKDDTSFPLAFTSEGRTVNERYKEYFFEDVADFYISVP